MNEFSTGALGSILLIHHEFIRILKWCLKSYISSKSSNDNIFLLISCCVHTPPIWITNPMLSYEGFIQSSIQTQLNLERFKHDTEKLEQWLGLTLKLTNNNASDSDSNSLFVHCNKKIMYLR